MHTDMPIIHILEIIVHTNVSNSSTSPQRSFWFSLISYLYVPSPTMKAMQYQHIYSFAKCFSSNLRTLLHTQKTVIFEKLVIYTVKNSVETIFHPFYITKLKN